MAFRSGRLASRGRKGSLHAGPTPEERLQRLNDAINAITTDDVRTVVSCIPGNIEVGAVYDLVLGAASSGSPRRVRATLLHVALYHSAAHCAKLLLHLGAPTEAPESQLGDRALHSAIRLGHYDLVMMLLEYGASPTSVNASLDTPLHLAAEKGLVHVVRTLLDAGAHPAVRNRYQETPWDVATLAGSPSSNVCADLILTKHLQNKDQHKLPIL
ncbi:ankyrin repeat and SOCS box protein 8 [Cherax quadricarinatus]|uniref:ankyrin repeat and SOCS box protein 8 n=1 Tax=Cherax quadricarinatus TaxID=27406 RepID=UPI002378328A|nr:ankyrin repeat domain-containing protein 27-like [Cherax quadricarinatus]